jgi:AraC-like DNA-binding protein
MTWKRSFDERRENFARLFDALDHARDRESFALALAAIVDLAKSSPLKDVASLADARATLQDPRGALATIGMPEVARALGVSGRSLQRRLRAAGTTFQAELYRVRVRRG